MYTALSLAQRLVDWLNGSSYAPGHPITSEADRDELQLGTLLDTVAALDETDAGHGSDLIGVYDEHSVFTGTTLTDVLYELYQAATSANSDTFTDTGNFYATDTVGAALVALGTALGGTNSTTRDFTGGTGTRVADNDSFFTALNKLDQGFVDLIAVTAGKGAALVGVQDAANWYAGLTVEASLAEISTALGGTNSTTRDYTGGTGTRLTDNDGFFTALNKLDLGFVALAATTPGNGAALIGINDAGNYITGTTVEAAFGELGAERPGRCDQSSPGNGGPIPTGSGSGVVKVTSSGAETRTLANPNFIGQTLTIFFQTDGGDVVITAASAINGAGNTQITLNDAGDSITLRGIHDGAGFKWRVLVNDGCTLA